jgi:hypothetical protein
VEGGNLFLGQKADGIPYMMVGEESVRITARLLASQSVQPVFRQLAHYAQVLKRFFDGSLAAFQRQERLKLESLARRTIAEDFRIAPENLVVLPQPEFHIDMAIRPLHYPYVLVNDFELSRRMLDRFDRWQAGTPHKDWVDVYDLAETLERYTDDVQRRGYATTDSVVQSLRAAGFVPLRVPGILGAPVKGRKRSEVRPINYTNAIVHQRQNGDLVYITNGSAIEGLNRMFKETLMAKVPAIKRVEFITGSVKQGSTANKTFTYMEKCLRSHGGIHCMVAEQPRLA